MFLDDARGEDAELTLQFAAGGKRYVVAPASAVDGLVLEKLAEGGLAEAARTKVTSEEIYRLALGSSFDEMLADLSFTDFKRGAMTAAYWQVGMEETAKLFWASSGKASTAPEESGTGTSTDVASTTRRRDSGTTTSTRTRKAPAKKATPGRKSSRPRTGG